MKTSFLHSRTFLWVAVGGGLVVIAAFVVGATALRKSAADRWANIPTFTVERGPLTISIPESGTIKSRQQEVIKSEVEGQNVLLYLVPEGTRVKKGDLLFELDRSKMEDQKVSQQIVVLNAEAAFIGAKETLAVTENQAKSDKAKAVLDAKLAKLDFRKYVEGDYIAEKDAAESKIGVAKEKLQRDQQKLAWSEVLSKEKYISDTELIADKLAAHTSVIDLNLAISARDLLNKYTYERKMEELKNNIDQTEMALDRVTRKGAADIVQAQATLRAKESEFQRQKMLLDKTMLMIEKTRVTAPCDGLVVYATTSEGRWNREPLQEGQSVRERQDIINLPTTSSVMADVKVHESNLDKISLGLPVSVTVEAIPGKVLTGRLGKIAPLPDANSMWMNPDMKVYNTEVYLDQADEDLRTGMTCRARIIVDHYPDAVYVPVQSIVRVGGQPTAYVMTSKGPQPRSVELGLDNNSMVRILKGLEPGERIMLNPPLADASSPAEATPNMPLRLAAPDGGGPQTRPSAIGMDVPQPGRGRLDRRRGESDNGEADSRGATDRRGPGGLDSGSDRGEARGEGGSGRRGAGNLTAEQREEMRKRLESMTPEEREKMRQQFMQRRGGRGGGPGGPDGPGGPGGGPGGGRDSGRRSDSPARAQP